MGMINMELLHNRLPTGPAEAADGWWDQAGGEGELRRALRTRDEGVDGDVTKV
jgi:hypothetical protein